MYVDSVKVISISLIQAIKALSDIYKAKLADKLCQRCQQAGQRVNLSLRITL